MPKDEFDFDDPMELNGIGLSTEEDTTEAMAECFIEEFMRMGFNHNRILGLFHNPYYTGMNMILQNRGAPFVRSFIAATFAKWGRQITWDDTVIVVSQLSSNATPNSACGPTESSFKQSAPSHPVMVDPMGSIIPQETLGGSK